MSCRKHQEQEIKLPANEKSELPESEVRISSLNDLIQKINRTMLMHLSPKYPHLLHAEVDFEPRLEASWFLGGMEPSFKRKLMRKRNPKLQDFVHEPVTMPVQYNGAPAMHLRHKHPLREIISLSECENNPAFDVPTFEYQPNVLEYRFKRQHLTNIPGFWPGDENEFGFLSYHNCWYLEKKSELFNDITTALSVQAIFASYSWLLSQACYQGIPSARNLYIRLLPFLDKNDRLSIYLLPRNFYLIYSEPTLNCRSRMSV